MNIDQIYMKEALNKAKQGYKEDEVPVGVIIVKNNKIIAATHNKKESMKDATAHAEILAIKEACQLLNTTYLNDCDMYVTFEPCMMCTGAIINARIRKLVFGAYDHRFISLESILLQYKSNEFNHLPIFYGGILEEDCSKLMTDYFKKKRKEYIKE